MFEYQQTNRFFAQVAGGLEELGAEELLQFDAHHIQPAFRGIFFEADKATLYRINYCSRFLTRILAPLIRFHCFHTDSLYNKAMAIRWADLFSVNHSFAIFANVSNSRITHSQYAALRLKDAIVDNFRQNFQKRPDIDRVNPDVWINLHIENNRATISLDTSGGSLHRRGYRTATVEAPMQETVAAAIIHYLDWNGSTPIYDPMCGSGTLLSEALMAYCLMPAGYLRKHFGFEFLPDFDKATWQSVKQEADQQIRQLPDRLISGSDIASKAVEAARTNFRCLPQGNKINLAVLDFQTIEQLRDCIIVCNPPYGIRLGDKKNLGQFYQSLGDFLKQRCQGSTAFIYFGNRDMLKHIGLKPSWKKPLENGGLDGRLAKFEIY
ncbi:class I SAM-dependent RNA methyltransferase [candidate division KSB1 bacterium]|nr:MAG: class I SAM-dependent RNA methyltransferase [candidate division KSB1 bacterium]